MPEANNQSIEQSRVESVYVERLFNLGNYENIKYGVRVVVAPGDDPGRVLTSLENILNDLRADHGVSDWYLERAKREIPELEAKGKELSPADKQKLEDHRATLSKVEEASERRRKAREALATLNYTSEQKNHKLDWNNDVNDVYEVDAGPDSLDALRDDDVGF
jgi:hypothetical protein